jgi:hypothetical protein
VYSQVHDAGGSLEHIPRARIELARAVSVTPSPVA